MADDIELPALPPHPEIHTYRWSDAELRAIELYGRACVAAAAAKERERVAADAKDAARYRWLRAQHWEKNTISAVPRPKDAVRLGTYVPSLERLDDAIDAVMQAEGGEGEEGEHG